MAAEKAWREEDEHEQKCMWEQERLAKKARAQAKEEVHACEEEERVAVENSLCEAGGLPRGRPHGNDYSCHRRNLPEVQRWRRRPTKKQGEGSGSGSRVRPGGRSQGSYTTSVTKML